MSQNITIVIIVFKRERERERESLVLVFKLDIFLTISLCWTFLNHNFSHTYEHFCKNDERASLANNDKRKQLKVVFLGFSSAIDFTEDEHPKSAFDDPSGGVLRGLFPRDARARVVYIHRRTRGVPQQRRHVEQKRPTNSLFLSNDQRVQIYPGAV